MTDHTSKTLWRRLALAGCVAALALPAAAQQARAPKGPIEITVGTSPGGTPDVIMRRVAKMLADEKIVDLPMAVVNRTGGSWTVSNNFVMGKKGDEQIIYCYAAPVFTSPIVQGTANVYDKFTPIAIFVQGDLMVIVQPDQPAKTLKDLMAVAKQKERSIKVAGAQLGATDSQAIGILEKAAGVKFNYVAFDGGGAAMATFLGKNVDIVILNPDEALPHIKAGKAKALAVLSSARRTEPDFKDVPTAKEQGISAEWGQAWGIAGPPGLDPAVAKWWEQKIVQLTNTAAWKKALADNYHRGEVVIGDKLKPWLDAHYKMHLTTLKDLGIAKEQK